MKCTALNNQRQRTCSSVLFVPLQQRREAWPVMPESMDPSLGVWRVGTEGNALTHLWLPWRHRYFQPQAHHAGAPLFWPADTKPSVPAVVQIWNQSGFSDFPVSRCIWLKVFTLLESRTLSHLSDCGVFTHTVNQTFPKCGGGQNKTLGHC